MAWLLDTDVFIQAKNLHYGFDFCPGFWDALEHLNLGGRLFSVAKVQEELARGDDDLKDWAAARGPRFFLPPDEATQEALRRVAAWVTTSSRYEYAAHSNFLAGADPLLIAHALAHGLTVVTNEKRADTPKKVKIPNVCLGLGVRYATIFDCLRGEQVRLGLNAPP
ncbi:MAG: DUF4411 family protein [Myxococcales bacterium]|nr:DUF4411 family protein [Myxococcales bacterium]